MNGPRTLKIGAKMICPICLEEIPRDAVLFRYERHDCPPEEDDAEIQAGLEASREAEKDREFDERCALGYV